MASNVACRLQRIEAVAGCNAAGPIVSQEILDWRRSVTCQKSTLTMAMCMSLIALATSARGQSATAITPAEATDLIIGGLRSNYGSVATAQGVITFEKERSKEIAAQVRESAGQASTSGTDGLAISSAGNARDARSIRFAIDGGRLRFDGTFLAPDGVAIVDGEQVQLYLPNTFAPQGGVPEHASMQVQSRQVQSQQYRDPREVLFHEGLRLQEVLLSSRITRAERIEDSDGMRLLLVELDLPTADGARVQLVCDENRNYIPIRSLEIIGGVEHATLVGGDFQYAEYNVGGKRVWLPRALQFALLGSPGETPFGSQVADRPWTSKLKYTVQDLQINPPVDSSSFAIARPDGTHVADLIKGTDEVVGRELGGGNSSSRRSWWVSAFLALLVAILAIVAYRRRLESA